MSTPFRIFNSRMIMLSLVLFCFTNIKAALTQRLVAFYCCNLKIHNIIEVTWSGPSGPYHGHPFFYVILHYSERIFWQNLNSLIYIAGKCPSHSFLKFLDLPLIKPLPTIHKFPRLKYFYAHIIYIYIKLIEFGMTNNHLNFTDSLQWITGLWKL